MKSDAKAGLLFYLDETFMLKLLLLSVYRGSELGGEGDFRIFLIYTLFYESPPLFLFSAIMPLRGLTFTTAILASLLLGASGEVDFFLMILSTFLLTDIFLFGFGLPSPRELTIG
jgi:hypothetical protein